MAERFEDRVLAMVEMIPSGRVTTYGHIAWALGSPRSARIVGGVLQRSLQAKDVPCHRVVNRDGVLTGAWAFERPGLMRELLEAEGVSFTDADRVDLRRCLWEPPSDEGPQIDPEW